MKDDVQSYIEKIREANKRKRELVDPFVEFDEFIPDGPTGYTKKRFVRTFGWYLLDMYDDLMDNPDNNYVTCIDKLLKDPYLNDYTFSQMAIPSIVKEFTSKTHNNNPQNVELVCSRLANVLGIKTNYVAPHKVYKNRYIVIDFLKDNEQLENFEDFTESFKKADAYGNSSKSTSTIKSWIEKISRAIDKKVQGPKQLKQQIKDRVIPEFIRQYIFKKYIVHDYDMVGVNFGFIHTKPDYTDLKTSPCYDYEMCFNVGIRTMQGDGMEEDIFYLVSKYSSYMKEVMSDFNIFDNEGFINVTKRDQIKDIFNNFKINSKTSEEQFNIVMNSLISLNGIYNTTLSTINNGMEKSC